MIKWMAAAAASAALVNLRSLSAAPTQPPRGYGLNPDYSKSYKPGDVWPLTLTLDQLQTVAALCDLILPADKEAYESVPVAIGCIKGGFDDAIAALTAYRRAACLQPHEDNTQCPVIFNDYMNCLLGDPTADKETPLITANIPR